MRAFGKWLQTRRLGLAASVAVAVFAVLAGRFWHPCYGFTKFLQFDSSDEKLAIHEVRERPIYVYPGNNGYDGFAYAEIAFHPLLDSPELQPALGNVPYRARRILGSALAWLLAGGEPDYIADVYAGLNLGVWLVFAALLWWLLPVRDWRGWIAWAGLLFSAGALHAVRLALTDLPGVTLFAAAMLLAERRRPGLALGTLAIAGLARETTLAGVVALWRGPWNSPRAWFANALRTLAVAAPLVAWLVYVRWKAGPADQGLGNFTWPIAGWIEKWSDVFAGFKRDPDFTWLNTTTLLATAGLTAQAVYLLHRPQPGDAWWRAGATGVAMMALLGTSVWEGHPGAATRVLLPMSLAFAVLAVRQRAAAAWLLAGNLTVFSGVLALWHVPQDAREFAAGRSGRAAYVARLGEGWFGCERDKGDVWAWTPGNGQLTLQTWPNSESPLRVRLGLRAITPRTVEIRQDTTLLWRGPAGAKLQWIEFDGVAKGRAQLQFSTDQPAVRESDAPNARALGFAVYDLRIK
jgi:hypothetical protein